MRIHLLIGFLLFCGLSHSQNGFKDKFNEARDLMKYGDYSKALSIWLDLEKTKPENANIQFSIADCYMHSRFEKKESIPYLLKAEQKLTNNYQKGDFREEYAPMETIFYLGKAYHLTYQFELALDKFLEYKNILFRKNKDDLKRVQRAMEITRNAQLNVRDSVNVTIRELTALNTEFPEYRPVFNADETMIIFTARRPDSKGGKIDEMGYYYEDIYVAYNNKGTWTTPKQISENINTNGHEATVFLTPSGNKLLTYKDRGGEMGGGIYESVLEGDVWTRPRLLKSKLNSKSWETHASISADGRLMAFISDRKGGKGGRDIWFIKKLPNGAWGDPYNLGADVNTKYDEASPYLHPDGKTLYFSSQGHNTMGGFDIYSIEIGENGSFSEPRNMGYPINTTGDDVFFTPSANGKKAYFSSYRKNGTGHLDLFVLDLNEEKEKSLTIYKGLAHDVNGDIVKNLVITVFDAETDDLFGIFRPNPITGKFMFILRPGHTYEIEYEVDGVIQTEQVVVEEGGGIKQVGRVIVKENNKIVINAADARDIDIKEMARMEESSYLEIVELDVNINTNTVKKAVKDSVKIETQHIIDEVLDTEGTVALNNVLFEFNSAEITEGSKENIDFIFNYLKERKNLKLMISGHTDDFGDDSYNQRLSEKRARSVKEYLSKKGISKKKLKSRGYGESKPIQPNRVGEEDNPEGRRMNRRVEFEVIK